MPNQPPQWSIDLASQTARHNRSPVVIWFRGNPEGSDFHVIGMTGGEQFSHIQSLTLLRKATAAYRHVYGIVKGRRPKPAPAESADESAEKPPTQPRITVKPRKRRLAYT